MHGSNSNFSCYAASKRSLNFYILRPVPVIREGFWEIMESNPRYDDIRHTDMKLPPENISKDICIETQVISRSLSTTGSETKRINLWYEMLLLEGSTFTMKIFTLGIVPKGDAESKNGQFQKMFELRMCEC